MKLYARQNYFIQTRHKQMKKILLPNNSFLKLKSRCQLIVKLKTILVIYGITLLLSFYIGHRISKLRLLPFLS